MAKTIVHGDFEVLLDIVQPLRETNSVWIDVTVRHVVTGVVVYACVEPYPVIAGDLSEEEALKSAITNACGRIEFRGRIDQL
ncbi:MULTISPECIES: hypothetical protein [Caballeronia]|uniref:Uncharacterized protein n=1 Tax=Caballeronia zhejiangensis TaxID=871203 RepID=A0A656QBV5_9BURK|nr:MULTISPECIES: hypothetical protein [Caballeronia]EKS71643.1 hypothetical protein BURK_007381 [Burkholderia sp. SJ98]KDR24676.1 hypothetical protein BG60_35860 [Caballeronia zhejiangensis]MDR5784974.1 hypothetical protein [Caballeronia sp. LP003]